MCGIVGILGKHQAAPTLVDALRRLEYRGYDSAGIATVNDSQKGALDRRRAVGKLVNLTDTLVHKPLAGKAGIGHTRWATHGAATIDNAHPHRAGGVAVVHNGIIENYKTLRAKLHKYNFESDTDTEIISALCQKHLAGGLSPIEAAKKTIKELQGAYALCFLFEGEDDLLIAARHGSPLAIGYGMGEMFVGSDAIALHGLADKITYLEEGDCAVITRRSVVITDEAGAVVVRKIGAMNRQAVHADKGAYKHFMMKEINEQPVVLADGIAHYIDRKNATLTLPDIGVDFAALQGLTLIACGTAHLAASVAKYWFEQLAGVACSLDIASEFRYRNSPMRAGSVAIFISQSGETADTLAAMRHCKSQGVYTVGIVNVAESSIAREADAVLPIHAGVEIGVASTKAFTSQLLVLLCLAVKAADERGTMDADAKHEIIDNLLNLPDFMNQALSLDGVINKISQQLMKASSALFLGRGMLYPIAMEGALKLKEISYIHAEGYASGELKHGPIALVDERMPIVVFAPKDAMFDKTISNVEEVLARGGKVVLLTDSAGAAGAPAVWKLVEMPAVPAVLAAIVYAVPAQLLAYHTAVAKGTDVDQPRNLAKSVTVE